MRIDRIKLKSQTVVTVRAEGWRESQVQKSLPGKHAVDSAQLRRERLDVLRMLGRIHAAVLHSVLPARICMSWVVPLLPTFSRAQRSAKVTVHLCCAGVLLQQLLKHIERDASLAAACAAQVIKCLAGLLRHAWEDFKVLDMLKLLEPLGAWLKEAGSSTAADLGELTKSMCDSRKLISLIYTPKMPACSALCFLKLMAIGKRQTDYIVVARQG